MPHAPDVLMASAQSGTGRAGAGGRQATEATSRQPEASEATRRPWGNAHPGLVHIFSGLPQKRQEVT